MHASAVVGGGSVGGDAGSEEGLARELDGVADVAEARYACAAFDGARVGVVEGGYHDGGFHFDGACFCEDAAAAAVEEGVIFEEGDGVDGGVEGCGAILQEGVC